MIINDVDNFARGAKSILSRAKYVTGIGRATICTKLRNKRHAFNA